MPPGVKSFVRTSPITGQQATPSSLSGKIRIDSEYASEASVELLRNSSTNYSLAITIDEARNVTVFLQQRALASSQNITNVTAHVDGEPIRYGLTESRGSGWVAFRIDHFSTRTVSFTSGETTAGSPSLPALPGQATPPANTDGDATFEDVDGDGAVTVDDVRVFANATTSNTVQNNVDAFDFDGDGSVTESDVDALYAEQLRGPDGTIGFGGVLEAIDDFNAGGVVDGVPDFGRVLDSINEFNSGA
jgi:hypothetical protein